MDTSAAGPRWAIATPHTLATDAGAEAFERGGNAIDAALAAATTLAVVYPHMCGVGGDLFALVQRDDGAVTAVNSSGRAPAAADADLVRGLTGGHVMPARSPYAVTVPGAIAGWRALHDQGGALEWRTAFDRARSYARDGAPVAPGLAVTARGRADARVRPRHRVSVLPRWIRARRGRDPRAARAGHYARCDRRRRARRPVSAARSGGALRPGSRSAGVPIALATSRRTAPISCRRCGAVTAPSTCPSCLRTRRDSCCSRSSPLVERLGIDPDPFGPDAAVLARIMRRHRRRSRPPSRRPRPHGRASVDAARRRAPRGARRRGPRRRASRPRRARPSGDTIALVTADTEGRAVSLIQSLFDGFGSGHPRAGHRDRRARTRGACFTLEPGHPNELRGGARPAHTLMPALAHREGRLAAVAGTMGGYAQPQINAMTLIRAFDLGMTPRRGGRRPALARERDGPVVRTSRDPRRGRRARADGRPRSGTGVSRSIPSGYGTGRWATPT